MKSPIPMTVVDRLQVCSLDKRNYIAESDLDDIFRAGRWQYGGFRNGRSAIQIEKGSQSGTITVNEENGWIVSGKYKQSLKMLIKMEGIMSMEVPMSMENVTTYTTVK